MKIARTAALAVLAALGTACISTEPLPTRDYGFISLVGDSTETAAAITAPMAYFFRSQELAFDARGATIDRCQTSLIPSDDLPALSYLDAGPAVTLTLSSGTHQLPRVVSPGLLMYSQGSTARLDFSPGEILTVSIPGADGSFPAAQFTATTATSFTAQPVSVPATPTEGLPLSWTPAGPVGSTGLLTSMTVSLRYASSGSAVADEQLYCVLVDDGEFEVPGQYLTGWRAAAAETRTAQFERVRVNLHEDETTGTVVDLVSSWLTSADVI